MHRHVGVPGESAPRAPSTDRSLKVTACVALVGAMFFLKLVGPGDTSDGGVSFEELIGLAMLVTAAVLGAVILVRRHRRTRTSGVFRG